ncbi:MAG: alginate export family protein [Desulfuromonadaceae bacterium]|nr:alginate export family protein [Desulfuromonadaceae bacterium]
MFLLRLLLLFMFLTLTAMPAFAATGEEKPYSIYLDLRYRYEYQHHFNLKAYGENPAKGESCDGFWLHRLRVGGTLRLHPNLILAVGIQDARVFESDLDANSFFYSSKYDHENNSYEDHWELYQTYLELRNLPNSDWSLRAGRQSIAYGNNRIFGPGSWGNSGRYHWDAIKISWRHDQNFIDLLWGGHILHEPEQFSLHNRHAQYGLGSYSHFQLADNWAIEPFYVLKTDEHDNYLGEKGNSDDLLCHNLGLRTTLDAKNYFLDATVVNQWGHYGDDDIEAWGGHLKFGHHFKESTWHPDLSLEYSYASGDTDPEDGTHEGFMGVFGARDKMYGRMNLLDWSNLHDLQCNVELFPRKKMSLLMELHRFWLASGKDGWSLNGSLYRDKSGRSGSRLGDEIDLIFSCDLPLPKSSRNDSLMLMLGYSHFWPGPFVKNISDNSAADWFFAQLQYHYQI